MTPSAIPCVESTSPRLLCSTCDSSIGSPSAVSALTCAVCKQSTAVDQGVWLTLTSSQFDHYRRFINEYEYIRCTEGRGSKDSAYYRSLPFLGPTEKLAHQWKIRAKTFQYLVRTILPTLSSQDLHILDLGAGNGWLSNRLKQLGHFPIAVDILTNEEDGLAAGRHYATSFPRVQATFDRLPFSSNSVDLTIFNASFHYVEDPLRCLRDAIRCTRPGGLIVIADTPWYAREHSGRRMVEEKHRHFLATYGFAANSLASQEFLTPARLKHLADALNLKWQIHKPYYGIAWSLRPLLAKLDRRRPPSRFHLFVAEVPA